MNPVLTDLDDIGAHDCKGERGAYSTESMCVKFDFKRDAFSSALLTPGSSGALSQELRTCVHETTHHIHNVTTPFGLFVHTLRALQSSIVYDIGGMIRQAGLPLRFPLIGNLDSLPKPLLTQVEGALRVWYTAELFVLRTFGETARWKKHYDSNPYIVRTDFGAQLEFLEQAISVNAYFESLRLGDHATEIDVKIPKSSETDRRFDMAQLASEWMTVPTNLRGILESAATVAELWGSDMTFDEFRETVEKWQSAAIGTVMAPYRFPVRYAIEAIGAVTLQQFVFSYLALCETALFCPTLPEYSSLRGDARRLIQITPFLRWVELVSIARSVKPVEDIGDYARYTNDLCTNAGWATPQELVRVRIENFPRDEDPRRTLYRDSQELRRNRPSFFIEYPNILFGPLSREWAFPVIEYEDRVLFHVDKVFLARVRESYIARLLSRRLLLREDFRIPCPYRASAEEREELTTALSARLESTWLGKLEGFAIV